MIYPHRYSVATNIFSTKKMFESILLAVTLITHCASFGEETTRIISPRHQSPHQIVKSNHIHKISRKRRTSDWNGQELNKGKVNKNNNKRGVILSEVFKNHSFSRTFQPRKVKNHAATNVDELQFKRTLLPQETLNELRKALLVHPFKTWKLRHVFASMKDIRIDENKLQAVIANGRNRRLKRKLKKVLRGEDIYLDIIGGSNTAGGGIFKEGGLWSIYPKVITHWWGKAITPITGSHLRTRQIATGGTASDFFQYCFRSYTHEQLDLVLLEMAVNDLRKLPRNANKSLPLEQLTRQLLAYPTEPALIYVNAFNGTTCKSQCLNLEDYGLGILSRTYNITSLSWRDAVCPRNGGKTRCNAKACEVICKDGFHINQLGHAHISLMLINSFRRILFDHISSVPRSTRTTRGTSATKIVPTRDDNRGISRQRIHLPPPIFINKSTNIISKPLCWTSLTPNRQKNEIKNNLDVVVVKNDGFRMVMNKRTGGRCKLPCREDGFSSWSADTVGASTSLWLSVPARRSTDGIKSRSVVIAVRTGWTNGAANVWLDDDNENKKFVNAKLMYGRTVATILGFRVKPGGHTVNIEVAKKGDVTIIALMIGPPDGPY